MELVGLGERCRKELGLWGQLSSFQRSLNSKAVELPFSLASDWPSLFVGLRKWVAP